MRADHRITKSSHRGRRFGTLAMAGAAAASSGMAIAASAADSAAATRPAVSVVARTDKPVKPDFAYYAGKTVNFITGGSPGGTNDELALILSPLMAAYLHCTINVTDIPAGATVPAQDEAAAAPPNGLTFGQMGPIGNVENEIQNIPDVNFHMVQEVYIGGVSPQQYMFATTKVSGIRTLSGLIKSPAVKFLALSGGGQLAERVLSTAYNMHATLVTGYANGAALETGFLRGDGTATAISVSSMVSSVEAGQVNALALIVPYTKNAPDYAQVSKLPLLSTYIAAHPPKTRAGRKALQEMLTFDQSSNQVLFASAGTPAPYAAALSAAFHSALEQPGAQAAMINAGVPNGYFSATAVRNQILKMIKTAPSLLPFLRT